MAEPKSNVDVFGSYLSRVGKSVKGAARQSAGAEDDKPEMMLLRTLALEEGAVSIKQLMSRLDLQPSLLMKTLASLVEAKLVETTTTSSDECVALTDLGRRIVG